jgi:hypothetical protein
MQSEHSIFTGLMSENRIQESYDNMVFAYLSNSLQRLSSMGYRARSLNAPTFLTGEHAVKTVVDNLPKMKSDQSREEYDQVVLDYIAGSMEALRGMGYKVKNEFSEVCPPSVSGMTAMEVVLTYLPRFSPDAQRESLWNVTTNFLSKAYIGLVHLGERSEK